MDDEWIDLGMRLTACIVTTEAQVSEQTIALLELAERGQDTAETETLLTSYMQRRDLLREMQALFLEDQKGEG